MSDPKRFLLLVGAAALLGCADTLSSPPDPVKDPAIKVDPAAIPGLLVSEARPASTSAPANGLSDGAVAYLSLPPGTLPGVDSVRIRNLASGAAPITVTLRDGGFDPVSVQASAGEPLELVLTLSGGGVSIGYARVPASRPPVIVRTLPPKGRTDVALGIIPTIIFSEPMDERTLHGRLRLFKGEQEVAAEVQLLAAQPWTATLVPEAALEPATAYELRIARGVQDIEGDSLESALSVPFTTDTAAAPPAPPEIAIVVSEPRLGLAYVSLPSGVLPPVIHHVVVKAASGDNSFGFSTAQGGLDPVWVRAKPGDDLELRITNLYASPYPDTGLVMVVTVPERRAPVLLRVIVAEDVQSVPVRTIPTLVFSEPIDSTSLGSALTVLADGVPVASRVQLAPQSPWLGLAVIGDATQLAGETGYDLHVSRDVRDLDADVLEAGATTSFVTAAAPPLPQEPPPAPPISSRIVFGSDRNGPVEIFTANGDGSEVTRIASGFDPEWSRDGTRILYTGEGRDGTGASEIRVVDPVDGSDRRIVYGEFPSWSPDGSRIAFVSGWPRHGIYTANADGSEVTLLLAADSLPLPANWSAEGSLGWLQWPVWSPDGTRIAFEWILENGGAPWLWIMAADGTARRPLATPETAPGISIQWRPAWSPDGSRIAFNGRAADMNRHVVASIAASGADYRIHYVHSTNQIWGVDWSPDGRLIAFASIPDTWWQNARIHVVDIETGASAQLIPDAAGAAFPGYRDWGISWARTIP